MRLLNQEFTHYLDRKLGDDGQPEVVPAPAIGSAVAEAPAANQDWFQRIFDFLRLDALRDVMNLDVDGSFDRARAERRCADSSFWISRARNNLSFLYEDQNIKQDVVDEELRQLCLAYVRTIGTAAMDGRDTI